MKKVIFIITLFLVQIAHSQIELKGIVKDSLGAPLEMANVVAIHKATKKMEAYGFTDFKGRYKLDLKKNTAYNIKISYVGMKAADLIIETKETDIEQDVTLAFDDRLNEINIVSKMPVTIKGDTIIYDADSFKNGTDRKLKHILKEIPGFEVDDEGRVKVNGKSVKKVMLEGKDFFGGDTKLATNNIPSNAVDKVELLRNYTNVNQLRGVEDNEDNIALNIKLKEGKKKFWFGDITGGGGDADEKSLYVFQPKLFYYSPKYSVNFIGDINNIGEVGFTRSDYYRFERGYKRPSSKSGTEINWGNNSASFLTLQNNRAKDILTKFGGLNLSYSPIKTLEINTFAILSANRIGLQQNRSFVYTDSDLGIPNEDTKNSTKQVSDLGMFRLNTVYKPNINNQLEHNLSGRISKERQDRAFNSSVIGNIGQQDEIKPFKISQNFNYYYTLKEDHIFALEAHHILQDEDPFYNAILEEKTNYNNTAGGLGFDLNQAGFDIVQNKRIKSNQLDVKLDYWNVINEKSNVNLTLGNIYSNQEFQSNIFQNLDDGSIFNPVPTIGNLVDPQNVNDTEYTFSDLYLGLAYQFKTGIFTFNQGVMSHSYVAKNTQFQTETFRDHFFRLLPRFNMIIKLKQSEKIRFNYTMQTRFTDINQIARGLVLNNYNNIFSGNPELESSLRHQLSLSYYNNSMYYGTNIFGLIRYSKTIDNIRTSSNFDSGSVVSVRTPFNSMFEDETLTTSGSFEKSFRRLTTSISASFNYRKFNQFINNRQSINESYSQNYLVRLGTKFKRAPNINVRYRYSISDNDQGSTRTKFYTHAPSINFNAYIWEKLTFKTNYSFTRLENTKEVLNDFEFWNVSLSYRKNKDAMLEYQLKATNILDTKSLSNTSVGALFVNTSEYFIQPRFITLRIVYDF